MESVAAVNKFKSALGGTRTPNLLIRSQTLYPIELQAQIPKCRSLLCGSTLLFMSGGEGGIRTHEEPLGPYSLSRGAPSTGLGHLSLNK